MWFQYAKKIFFIKRAITAPLMLKDVAFIMALIMELGLMDQIVHFDNSKHC